MSTTLLMNSPVVVGGLGGSGTRVIAELLRQANYYIGGDLNRSLDNLWFTILFRRPRWFMHASPKAIGAYLQIFEQVMLCESQLSIQQRIAIYLAALDFYRYERTVWKNRKFSWVRKRLRSIFDSHPNQGADQSLVWGWKEPNAHLALGHIAKRWSQGRYVHVIRHGLDMAFSKNQSQLVNWGQYFGVEFPEKSESLPGAALEFWVKANQETIMLAKASLGERFYLLNFDQLCETPIPETEQFLRWLGVDLPAAQLARVVIPPISMGRYQRYSYQFDPDLVAAVETMGFPVEIHKAF